MIGDLVAQHPVSGDQSNANGGDRAVSGTGDLRYIDCGRSRQQFSCEGASARRRSAVAIRRGAATRVKARAAPSGARAALTRCAAAPHEVPIDAYK